MPENQYCENCGQMLVNGVCPNCQNENFTSGAADEAPVYETVPGYTPYCETPNGKILQQAAGNFGFFKDKEEKIQCIHDEKRFKFFMKKRRLKSKGFALITDKNAYLGGKMIMTSPNGYRTKEKCVKAVPLKDISAVGLGGKYIDLKTMSFKFFRIVINYIIAASIVLLGYFLFFIIDWGHSAYIWGVMRYVILPPLFILLCLFFIARGICLTAHGVKVLLNVQHSGGNLWLYVLMPPRKFANMQFIVQHINECIVYAKIAEEERLAEEARIAEIERVEREKRFAEEKRLAEEKRIAEEARLAEEKRIAEENQRLAEEERLKKEAAAMQQAMEKAMQSAPASAPSTIAEELKTYSEMYKQGLINDEEFAAFKAKLLNK